MRSAKSPNQARPIFGDPKQRKRWKHVAPYDIRYQTNVIGYNYQDDYFAIWPDGRVVVKEGYASDGCTPKIYLGPILGVWGVPDGALDPVTRLPTTGRAFFIHDSLLQYRYIIGITPQAAHSEFCREIKASSFPAADLYCWFVRHLGPKK